MKTTQLKNHETERFEPRQLPAPGDALPPAREAQTDRSDETGGTPTEQNTIKQMRGKKLIKWRKQAETTTLNMNFKLAIVSSVCPTTRWVMGKAEAGGALPHTHRRQRKGQERLPGFGFQLLVLICICGSISEPPSVPQGAVSCSERTGSWE